MGEGEEEISVEEVLDEIIKFYPEALSFTSSDPVAIPEVVQTLTVVAVSINLLSIREFGGRLGPQRSKGLVEQVVAAAFQWRDMVDFCFQVSAGEIRDVQMIARRLASFWEQPYPVSSAPDA